MKKAIIAIVVSALAMMAFLGTLVVAINARGGVSGSYEGVQKIPVLGSLLKVKPPAEESALPRAAGPDPRSMPFLHADASQRLARLADELELKIAEYESRLTQLKRQARELEAWESQLKLERDNLREHFGNEKEQLAALRRELEQEAKQLEAARIAIKQEEQSNLTATAQIYDKMASEQAAKILMEMYAEGEQDTVVKLLSLMQQRSAAKALEAVPDPKISAQITEKLQKVSRPSGTGG